MQSVESLSTRLSISSHSWPIDPSGWSSESSCHWPPSPEAGSQTLLVGLQTLLTGPEAVPSPLWVALSTLKFSLNHQDTRDTFMEFLHILQETALLL